MGEDGSAVAACANGAETLRLACIACTEAGLEIVAPVHDALMLMAPLEPLESDVAVARALMERAGRTVTGRLTVRTDKQIVRYPDRYMDERGAEMWQRVDALLSLSQAAVKEPTWAG